MILLPGIVVLPLPQKIRTTIAGVETVLFPSKEPGGTRDVMTPI